MNPRDRFLDQYVRSRHFQLGVPKGLTISPDGERVVFSRSRGGTDPVSCLWVFDVADGTERLVADPALIVAPLAAAVSQEERVLRERKRERNDGINTFATDGAVRSAVFVTGGKLAVVDLADGEVRLLSASGPVFDPRLSPDGKAIAYVQGGALRVVGVDGADERTIAVPENDQIAYGLAEHVAAESIGRFRGYWWSADSSRVLTARVDVSMVERWYIGDPTDPGRPPREVTYPRSGTANADVSLWIVGRDGGRTEVLWDREEFEYVVDARWGGERPMVVVQDRPQHRLRVLEVDPDTGATTVLREDYDLAWIAIVPGVPALTRKGKLIWTTDLDGARRLLIDGEPVTPVTLQVREVAGVDGDRVLFSASEEPTQTHLWEWSPNRGLVRLTDAAGVWSGSARGGTTLVRGRTPYRSGLRVEVRSDGAPTRVIDTLSEVPALEPNVTRLVVGERKLRVAVVLPTGHSPEGPPLPVLMDPYAGPFGQRVTDELDGYLLPQWFAEHGFAVVIADGRGTPGRSPEWMREIKGDTATPIVQDQVDALQGAAEVLGCLDLTKVGIRGWSFGGYVAALAVLRRPDVFHAAVAGAPVTDQRLYDTHGTEGFLGHPDEFPENYDRCSPVKDAHLLTRPIMFIHGLADDNVISAHTLRMSAALLAAERPHTVVPLPTSHMLTGIGVQKSMFVTQVDFIKNALGLRPTSR
jgi:dipeptidyl-peptidase-4